MPIETPWMTTAEAAEYARCHVQTVLKALTSGSLNGSQPKKNGKWIVHRNALDAWISGDLYEVPAAKRPARKSA